MKTKQMPELDITQPVELTISLPFQDGAFTVTGDYESVLPIATDYEKAYKTKPETRVAPLSAVVATKLGNLAVERKKEATALLYDARFGTSFHRELKRQKQLRRDYGMAERLGLL